VVLVAPPTHMAVAVAAQMKLVKPTTMALDRVRVATELLRQLLAHLFIEQVVVALEHIPDKEFRFLLQVVWAVEALAVTRLAHTTPLHITVLQILVVAVAPQVQAAQVS